MEDSIKEKEKTPKKGIKKIYFFGTITGSIAAITAGSFIVTHSFIQKKKEEAFQYHKEKDEELEKKGRKLYQKYKEENSDILSSIYQFYKKAGTAIYEENLAVITPGQNGYLVIDEEGIFKWVSFDGNVYDEVENLYEKNRVKEIEEEEKEEAIKSIMGIEKYTSFTLEDLTLIAEVKEGNLYQTIYQNSKNSLSDIKKVAVGKLVKTPYGYGTIYESIDGMIKTDNLAAFAILLENKDLYVSQKVNKEIKGKRY